MTRMIRTVAVTACMVLLASACSQQKDTGFPAPGTSPSSSPSATQTGGGGGQVKVEVVDSSFKPIEVSLKSGGTVAWSQTGSLPHSITADDGSFDSSPGCQADTTKCLQKGGSFQRAFTKPGTYAYHCVIHGAAGGVGMAGTVTVTA